MDLTPFISPGNGPDPIYLGNGLDPIYLVQAAIREMDLTPFISLFEFISWMPR